MPSLMESIPEASIPRYLGGKCDCADAQNECESRVRRQSMVPVGALAEFKARVAATGSAFQHSEVAGQRP